MKKKRVSTKAGDVFCVKIEGRWKSYFQYVCNDMSQLNSSVIRVFSRRYDIASDPCVDDIVSDEVEFYAHTVLKVGVEEGVWSKYGNAKTIDIDKAREVLFGTVSRVRMNSYMDTEEVEPLDNWSVWHIDCPVKKIGRLPESLREHIELGSVFPYDYILERIKYGYYRHTSPVFDVIKRLPHPEIDSYIRREEGDRTIFIHFKGDEEVEEIIVGSGDVAGFSEGCSVNHQKFWETNWANKEFISEKEFKDAFRKYVDK